MNEFERRMLDVIQNTSMLASVLRDGETVSGIDYFDYNITVGADGVGIASGATGQGTAQIQSDSDFAMLYMSGAVVDVVTGATLATQPNTTVQFQDTGNGKTFFNQPTLFGLVLGQGGFPFLLPAPRLIAPNTNIVATVVNRTSTNAQQYFISLMGARIYY